MALLLAGCGGDSGSSASAGVDSRASTNQAEDGTLTLSARDGDIDLSWAVKGEMTVEFEGSSGVTGRSNVASIIDVSGTSDGPVGFSAGTTAKL